LKRLEKEVANVQQVSVTLTLPKGLYDQSLRLVEKGIFTSFEEMVQSGLRKALIEGLLLVEADEIPSGLSGGERWAYYARKISDEIRAMGGLGLGDTKEEVLETLRETRQQLWEEKYAAYFGRK
jgi:Arc/MetJ-type ribon-helix-helix transcriptional regulator